MNISTKGSPPPPPPPPPPPSSIHTVLYADPVKEQQTNEVKPLSRLPLLIPNRTTSYPVTEVIGDKIGKNNLVNHHNQQQQHRTTGTSIPLQHHQTQQKTQQQQQVANLPPTGKQVVQEQAATDETDRVHAVSVAQRIDELETRFGGGGGVGGSGGTVGGCVVPVEGGGSSSTDDNSTSNHSSSPPDSGQDSGKDDISGKSTDMYN